MVSFPPPSWKGKGDAYGYSPIQPYPGADAFGTRSSTDIYSAGLFCSYPSISQISNISDPEGAYAFLSRCSQVNVMQFKRILGASKEELA